MHLLCCVFRAAQSAFVDFSIGIDCSVRCSGRQYACFIVMSKLRPLDDASVYTKDWMNGCQCGDVNCN